MTFDYIKKQVGKNLKYFSDAGGWLTGRDVTEQDIGEYVNEIYREDLFTLFATQYPHDFIQNATASNDIANGTVSTASTGNTLVTTTSIFTNGMKDLYVYNTTDDTFAKIKSFINASTVELDTEINDTWDGDAVRVLGQEFSLGGDADDMYVVNRVGVKYNANDNIYRQAIRREKQDFFQTGFEEKDQQNPIFYLTTLTVGNILKSAIGIVPKFKIYVEDSIQIEYISKPAKLVNGTDVPRLPVSHVLIYGATMRAFEKKKEFNEAAYYMNKYEQYKKVAISRYRPQTTRSKEFIRIPRHKASIFFRDI